MSSRRPGFELVVSAHKSVAVLGVIDRADAMHSILDAETAATMSWLDDWFQTSGGRRGRVQSRTATGGLTYAVTRHGTSRAGDPSPHDHVLVANVVEMLDVRGGHKALDSAALRDTVEAATMVGRLRSAARAVELGFEIAPDGGPSGNLRHWRIVGVPDDVCGLFSKRSDEIAEHLAETGQHGYRARGIAARETRKAKRHTGVDELLPVWHAELEAAGWPLDRLLQHVAHAQDLVRRLPFPLTTSEIDQLATDVLDVDGSLLARHKVFTRTHLVAEVAPRLYGRDPAELDRVLDRITASRDVVPLIRVAGVREQSYTTVEVLVAERTIAEAIERLAEQLGPFVHPEHVTAAGAAKEQAIGHPLTAGQRAVVDALCDPERAVAIVVGVAGSGKTTALDAASRALEASGYRVLGTSTSGQAARTLGTDAGIEARTFASLLWRLDHGQITLDARTVVVLDEAGMADDADLARLTLAVERTAAKLVMVGDNRQLAAVGPGGALAALLDERPELVVTLEDNVRQHDRAERQALAELRDGSVRDAVAWYAEAGRIHTEPHRIDTLVTMTEAWAADLAAGHDTALLAWRRADVAHLNRLARDEWSRLGHLGPEDVEVTGGRRYAVGDRVVALAPNHEHGVVTSERLTVTGVTPLHITARTSDDRLVTLSGEAIDSDHLDYAYALTVHRSQGATYDRAHVLAAGGGRELAYVALSRARTGTIVYATADDLAQAIDDLQADWGLEAHQRWISHTPAEIGLQPEPVAASREQEQPDAGPGVPLQVRRQQTRQHLAGLEQDLRDLWAGTGRWHDTPEGETARHRNDLRAHLDFARRQANSPDASRRDRRAAGRTVDRLTTEAGLAEHHWQTIGEPIADELGRAVSVARRELESYDLEDLRQRLDRLGDRDIAPVGLERSQYPERDIGLSR